MKFFFLKKSPIYFGKAEKFRKTKFSVQKNGLNYLSAMRYHMIILTFNVDSVRDSLKNDLPDGRSVIVHADLR